MRKLDTERASLDDALETAGAMDGLSLIQKKRLLSDQLDWLKSKLPALEQAAQNEQTAETKATVNARWEPLAEQRKELLASIEAQASELSELMKSLVSLTVEQRRVIDLCRSIDQQQPPFWHVAVNGSLGHMRLWLIHRLQLLDHRPDIRAQVPQQTEISEHESLTLRARLYP